MIRLCLWFLLTICVVVVAPNADAQQKPPPSTSPPSAALSPEQARAALETLNDPKKRAAFAATLEALVKGQPEPEQTPVQPPPAAALPAAPDPKPAQEGLAIQLAPDSLGAQVLLTASAFLNDMADEVPRALKAIQSIPLLWGWIVVMFTNPLGQQLLGDASWRLATTLIIAGAIALGLRRLVRRPMDRVLTLGRAPISRQAELDDPEARAEHGAIEAPPPRYDIDEDGRRIGLGLARLLLQMAPALGLLVSGHMVAASGLGGLPSSRLVILAVLDAIAASLALLALLTLLFKPDPPGLKQLAIRPASGMYLMRWGRRLILIAVPGYTIGEVALLLGLSPPAHAALQKTVGLVLMVCLSIIVVQRRRSVRRWLSAAPEAIGPAPLMRNWLARYWHWMALTFLAASWLTWALRAPDEIARTLWYFGVTAVMIAGASIARMTVAALLSPIQPGAYSAPDSVPAATTAHTVRSRLSAYHPALMRLSRFLITVFAILGLLQLYGLGTLSWLVTSDVGNRIASGFCTLAVTIGLAFAVWECVNIAIQMHLEALRRDAQLARSTRLRTLLPLIRTTLAITVAVVAGLMVLSEIGVNIAPLLAGAGIVGVAIGFGSQKRVQDVITGVFLLLENTMQVGDVVKVGDQSGVVESLSVRTIRLRTEDASVVVIPFSAVTTVINMTRDYSRAVISVNIALGEDVDRVVDAMRGIVREMREEEAWSAVILDELEVFGLDRFTDTALQIRCRIMCTPFGRWSVGREFNRRMRQRFQVVGVTTAFSALTLPVPEHLAADAPSHEPEADGSPAPASTVLAAG